MKNLNVNNFGLISCIPIANDLSSTVFEHVKSCIYYSVFDEINTSIEELINEVFVPISDLMP